MFRNVITFCGAQGSGKDTLCDELMKILYENGYDVVKCKSVPRRYIEKLGINLGLLRKNVEGYKVWQYFCFRDYVEELRNLVSRSDDLVVLVPRSIFDYYVYTSMFIGDKFWDLMYEDFKDDIEFVVKKCVTIYVSPLFNVDEISDEIRDVSAYYKEVEFYEKRIKHLCDFVLKSHSLSERMNSLIEYLRGEGYEIKR